MCIIALKKTSKEDNGLKFLSAFIEKNIFVFRG